MGTGRWRRPFAVAFAVVLVGGACSDDGDGTTTGDADDVTDDQGSATITVPGDHETIQAAVDAAEPGDLVLISPGTYEEAVDVTTEDLTIRGLDRAGVVLDGGFELANGIRVLGADGVAVENLTTQNYTANGVFWTGVEGFRGSYLTAVRNAEYGIYAFDSRNGLIEQSYASGSGDGGFYVGQCFPCDTLVRDVLSEHNGIGFSDANAGGNLIVTGSVFRNNRLGIVAGSVTYELCYPQRQVTIVGNLVHSNNQEDTGALGPSRLAMYNGIVSAGGIGNVIDRNRVFDHERVGIAVLPFPEYDASDDIPPPEEWDLTCDESRELPVAEDPPDPILWEPFDSQVIGNIVSGSGDADITIFTLGPDLPSYGNCIADNEAEVLAPTALAEAAPCDGEPASTDATTGALDILSWLEEFETFPEAVFYEDQPLPDLPDLEDMPEAQTAPPSPAVDMPPAIDLETIEVPAEPT
jgi:Right handed beta helix region